MIHHRANDSHDHLTVNGIVRAHGHFTGHHTPFGADKNLETPHQDNKTVLILDERQNVFNLLDVSPVAYFKTTFEISSFC